MSLTAAMNIGRSALSAAQLGIQVSGNNMANAATPGYSRQVARLTPLRGDLSVSGVTIGAGVRVQSVLRQVDDSVESRLRLSIADQSFAGVQSQIMSQIEDALGELGDNDLSSQLSSFFTGWSERANGTRSSAAVIQQGDQLASFIRRLRGDLTQQREQMDDQLGVTVERANQLLSTIADFNQQISQTEVAGNVANVLRDQRDQAVRELSDLMDVSVIDRGQQGIDVLAGSSPIILGGTPRLLRTIRETVNGESRVSVVAGENDSRLDIRSGRVGSILANRTDAIDSTIGRLDQVASQLIFEVNKLHATGARAEGLRGSTGQITFATADRTRAMNDPANAGTSGLPFSAVNGGFLIHVKQESTGSVQTVRINVDLDGLTNAGLPGTSDDTSVEDIRAQLAAIPGLSASFSPDGRLQVDASDGFNFSFAEDSSGALAVLGMNSYFTGTNASDIGVRSDLKADSAMLCAGRISNGQFVENGTALEMSSLQSRGLDSINGMTLQDLWRESVQLVGAQASTARTASDASTIVRESLESQRAASSGVSLDEEAMSLMDYQRQYQAAARLISVAEQMTQTLMELL